MMHAMSFNILPVLHFIVKKDGCDLIPKIYPFHYCIPLINYITIHIILYI